MCNSIESATGTDLSAQWAMMWPKAAERTAAFVRSLKMADSCEYRVSGEVTTPTAIASATAALVLGFLGAAPDLTDTERSRWADYLLQFQDNDGMFRDTVDLADPIQEQPRWALQAHRSRHCAWAIETFGYRLRKPISFVEPLLSHDALQNRLDELWREPVSHGAWRWGNWVMDIGVLLDLQHRHFDDRRALESIHTLLDWLDEHQDPRTGFWYLPDTDDRNAMAGAMHLYPLYWAYGRDIPQYERTTQETLNLQQPDGLFAYESGAGGSQCLDYDAVLILVNAYHALPDLQEAIRAACIRVLNAIVVNQNADGSWADCQADEMRNWGTRATLFHARRGSIWDAYARMMTVAMCLRIVDGRLPERVNAERHMFEIYHAGQGWSNGSAPGLANYRFKDN